MRLCTRSSSRLTTPENPADIQTTLEDESRANPRDETGPTPQTRPGNDSDFKAVRRTCQEVIETVASRNEDLEGTLTRATKTIQDLVSTMESRYQAPDAHNTDNNQVSQADLVVSFTTLGSDVNNILETH